MRVPTGAFVARRNGKVFVTGNSGFPKSLDVAKSIDKAAGVERAVIGQHPNPAKNKPGGASLNMSVVGMPEVADVTAPATDAAKQWEGWGTALKPAHEPIVVARKPLIGTVVANVLEHGTGALNIDATRVGLDGAESHRTGAEGGLGKHGIYGAAKGSKAFNPDLPCYNNAGRWPANVILDEESAALLDQQSGITKSTTHARGRGKVSTGIFGTYGENIVAERGPSDYGGASRFFYTAKASRSERGKGNDHPTVKPVSLMRWLVRLVVPPGGLVLDPFVGSGTTLVACVQEGFRGIGIEQNLEYVEIAQKRISGVQGGLGL